MPEIGQWNRLQAIRKIPQGFILDGKELGDILMPNKYCEGVQEQEEVLVFLYADSEDRLVATHEKPIAVAGEFALLECVERTRIGHFFELGLAKQLLVPFAELDKPVKEGESVIVRVYVDEKRGRLAGSTKLNKWLNDSSESYFEDQEVELLVAAETELGYKAIINQSDWGLIYKNQVFEDLPIGRKTTGYIHETRPDGKIDLRLFPAAEQRVAELAAEIMEQLKAKGGDMEISDKSPPESIREHFRTSKKNFKKALGYLYKQKLIEISSASIKLVSNENQS